MLIIYGDGVTGINAQAFYSKDFKTIVHREARWFNECEPCEAFALETSKTSHILRIREAYLALGIPEASRNRPAPPEVVKVKKNLTMKHLYRGLFSILDEEGVEMTRIQGKAAAEEYVNAYRG